MRDLALFAGDRDAGVAAAAANAFVEIAPTRLELLHGESAQWRYSRGAAIIVLTLWGDFGC